MKISATRSLLWKDYRAQRGLWLAILVLSIVFQIVLLINLNLSVRSSEEKIRLNFIANIGVAFTLMYAVACGVTMFGTDREAGSAKLLRNFPIAYWRMILVRFTFGTVSTFALLFVQVFALFLLVIALNGKMRLGLESPWLFSLSLPLFIMKSVLWGIFFSLIISRVLVSVASASVLVFGMSLFQVHFDYGSSRWWQGEIWPHPSNIFDLITIVVLFLLNVAVYRQWSRGGIKFRWFQLAEKKHSNVWKKYRTRRKSRSYNRNSFYRLLWISYKEVLRASRVPVLVAGVLCFSGYAIAEFIAFDLSIVIIPFMPIFLGVWVYRENHLRNTNRFYAERGISAGTFWMTKQFVWLAITLIVSFSFFAVDHYFEKMTIWERFFSSVGLERDFLSRFNIEFMQDQYGMLKVNSNVLYVLSTLTTLMWYFHYCLFAYCCAMWCSHWFRRTMTAFAAAVVTTAMILIWWFYMNWFEIPIVWSVYPLVLAMFLSSYLSTRSWLLERGKLLRIVRTSGLLAGCLVMVMSGVAWYRIASAPEVVNKSYSWYWLPPTPSDYALETGTMYRRASDFLVSLQSVRNKLPKSSQTRKLPLEGEHRNYDSFDDWGGLQYSEFVGYYGWDYSTGVEREWVRENRETIELALAASKRNRCAMQNPYDKNATPFYENDLLFTSRLGSVLRLLLFSARKLESEGKLEEAWTYYLAAFHMCWHLDEHPHEIFRNSHSRIITWAEAWRKHPKQKPEFLTKAFQDLKRIKIVKTEERTAEAIAFMQIEREKEHAFEGESTSHFTNPNLDDFLKRVAVTFMPWEKTRALRVLDYLNHNSWYPPLGYERDFNNWKADSSLNLIPRLDELTLKTRPRNNFTQAQHKQNLFLIQLALDIAKRKTGKLPERLEDLQPEFFDELPYDHSSGESYQYYRSGLPVDILYEGGEIKANTPFLFTPSPTEVRQHLFLIKANAKDNKTGKNYYTVLFYRHDSRSSFDKPLANEETIRRTIHTIEK